MYRVDIHNAEAARRSPDVDQSFWYADGVDFPGGLLVMIDAEAWHPAWGKRFNPKPTARVAMVLRPGDRVFVVEIPPPTP